MDNDNGKQWQWTNGKGEGSEGFKPSHYPDAIQNPSAPNLISKSNHPPPCFYWGLELVFKLWAD
jgi:hypothetical protein